MAFNKEHSMFNFNRLSPERFALLAAFLGVLLTTILDRDEQNAIGNFLASVGQTIMTSAAQADNIDAKQEEADLKKQVDDMSQQLESLKKKLKA